MIAAICKEMEERAGYLPDNHLHTLYFGGGSPSILSAHHLNQLIEQVHRLFQVDDSAEVTLEANPDDLSLEKLKQLKSLGVNRLSIGIQSFHDVALKWMNRAHNSAQAIKCVADARDAGIENISIDLIYGLPMLDEKLWLETLQQAIAAEAQHVSAYCLTVEEKTALHHAVKTNKEKPVDDHAAAIQFEILVNTLTQNGFEHYEISNFAKPGKYAVHNTSYWQNKPYLGVGPSAHSFNLNSRLWNIANNSVYIKKILSGEICFEKEELSVNDRYNEVVMTGLRTMWGVSKNSLQQYFPVQYEKNKVLFESYLNEGKLILQNDHYILAPSYRFMADGIAASLFA